jgi:hypothetical protein
MSEPNSSQNEQTPNSANSPSPSSWFAGWAEFSTEPPPEAAPEHAASTEASANVNSINTALPLDEPWEEWQPVNFPNAISANAIKRQSTLYGEAAAETPSIYPQSTQPQSIQPPSVQPGRNAASSGSAPPTTRRISPERPSWEVTTPAATEPGAAPPNVAELISLIQELNQCNNALLDRVSMLEDALEQQQARAATAVPEEIAAQIAADQMQAKIQPLEQQIVQLTEQLEATQQLSHRQQVLAETLTQELALSQERITQLEQENLLAQQRYEEQTQRLVRSEALVRDLQTRLQRQQRYTLQFKAALERCLEVPAALLDAPAEATASVPAQPWQSPAATELLSAPSLLPKAATIRPWSSEAAGSTVPPKLANVLASQPATEEETAAWLGDVVSADSVLANEAANASTALSHSDAAERVAESGAINAEEVPPPADLSRGSVVATNVISLQFGQASESQAPEAAIAPLETSPAESFNAPPAEIAPARPLASNPQPADELRAAELAAADNVRSLFQEFTELVNEVGIAPDTGGDAETTLWQDLAKLVEVSAEDLVQAGLIDQLASLSTEGMIEGHSLPEIPSPALSGADESQRQAAPRSSVDNPTAFAAAASAPIPPMPPRPVTVQPKLLTMPFETRRWTATAAESGFPLARPDSVDSEAADSEAAANLAPVVYPARSSKKLSSLAAIDLPNFPK